MKKFLSFLLVFQFIAFGFLAFEPVMKAASNGSHNIQKIYKGSAQWKTFMYHGYTFKYPSIWKPQYQSNQYSKWVNFTDKNGKEIATLTCPIMEAGFEAWDFTAQERLYKKNGKVYGVDLWLGMPQTLEDYAVEPAALLFMHRNTFDNWGGENDKDYNFSCQLSSFDAEGLFPVFQKIYKTVR